MTRPWASWNCAGARSRNSRAIFGYIDHAREAETAIRTQDSCSISVGSCSADFDCAETDLHVTILRLAPNKEILGALNRTHLLFGPTRYLLDPVLGIPSELIEDALQEHLRIIELLIAKSPDKAASGLHDHIEAAIDRWLRRFEIARKVTDIVLPPYLAPLRNL